MLGEQIFEISVALFFYLFFPSGRAVARCEPKESGGVYSKAGGCFSFSKPESPEEI